MMAFTTAISATLIVAVAAYSESDRQDLLKAHREFSPKVQYSLDLEKIARTYLEAHPEFTTSSFIHNQAFNGYNGENWSGSVPSQSVRKWTVEKSLKHADGLNWPCDAQNDPACKCSEMNNACNINGCSASTGTTGHFTDVVKSVKFGCYSTPQQGTVCDYIIDDKRDPCANLPSSALNTAPLVQLIPSPPASVPAAASITPSVLPSVSASATPSSIAASSTPSATSSPNTSTSQSPVASSSPSSTPSRSASGSPVATTSATPSAQTQPSSSASVSTTISSTSSAQPSASSSNSPMAVVSATPSAQPSPSSSGNPSPVASTTPSAQQTPSSSAAASSKPSQQPSSSPIASPSSVARIVPSAQPSSTANAPTSMVTSSISSTQLTSSATASGVSTKAPTQLTVTEASTTMVPAPVDLVNSGVQINTMSPAKPTEPAVDRYNIQCNDGSRCCRYSDKCTPDWNQNKCTSKCRTSSVSTNHVQAEVVTVKDVNRHNLRCGNGEHCCRFNNKCTADWSQEKCSTICQRSKYVGEESVATHSSKSESTTTSKAKSNAGDRYNQHCDDGSRCCRFSNKCTPDWSQDKCATHC